MQGKICLIMAVSILCMSELVKRFPMLADDCVCCVCVCVCVLRHLTLNIDDDVCVHVGKLR